MPQRYLDRSAQRIDHPTRAGVDVGKIDLGHVGPFRRPALLIK